MVIRNSARASTPVLLAALCGAMTAAGMSTVAFMVLAGVLASAAIVYRPEIGALLMIVLVAVLPREVLFERGLQFAGGALKITDLLILVTMGSWAAHQIVERAHARLPSGWTCALLALLIGCALVSVVTAHVEGVPMKLSLLELRPLLSYLLVFPLVDGIRTWEQLGRGLAIVLAAGAASATVALLDYARGVGASATYTGGALRVTDTVYLYAMLAVVWAPALLAYLRSPRLKRAVLILTAICLGGVFVTFARGAWLAILIAVPLAFSLLPSGRRARVLFWLVPAAAIMAVSVLTLNAVSPRQASPLRAGVQRLQSLTTSSSDVSARYRVAEWNAAADEIQKHPLTGIGLGNSVTFHNPMFSPTSNTYGYTFSTYYIHSSYVWFALKLGLLGAAVAFLLLLRTGFVALGGYRGATDSRARLVFLGSIGSLAALLVLAASGPHLNTDNATPGIAALIAAVELARRFQRTETDRP